MLREEFPGGLVVKDLALALLRLTLLLWNGFDPLGTSASPPHKKLLTEPGIKSISV